jgi:hypothetical protein
VNGDDLLHAYLTASADEAPAALARLCSEVLLPRCRLVVRARLWRHREEVEDVTHDVVTRLIRSIQQMRGGDDVSRVRCVTDWAAGAATKACSAFLRKEHPLRTHFANTLRYRLSTSIVFRMWRGPHARLVCGWRRCRSVQPLSDRVFHEVLALPRVAARLVSIDAENGASLWKPLAVLFACANGPVHFSSLVAELSGRAREGTGAALSIEDVVEPAGGDRADESAIRQELLRALWRSVMTLSRDERLALLLNLRGTEGLAAWWDHDVVPLGDVAAAAEVSPERVHDLPFSDFEIADRLGLEEPDPVRRRQRVINLRRSARRRLASHFDAR